MDGFIEDRADIRPTEVAILLEFLHEKGLGFALSALFGIPVAMLIAGSKTVESYVYPLLVFSQSVPKIAIEPGSISIRSGLFLTSNGDNRPVFELGDTRSRSPA